MSWAKNGTLTTTADNTNTVALAFLKPGMQATFNFSGTFTGVTMQIEGQGFNDTNWYPIICKDMGTGLSNVGGTAFSLTDNTAKSVACDVPTFQSVRCWMGAWGSGTVTVNITVDNFTNVPFLQSTVANASGSGLSVPTTITGTNANAFDVGQNGATNPLIQTDTSTASSATGFKLKSAAAASGVALSVISSGTNEGGSIDTKGSGILDLQATATGVVRIGSGMTFLDSKALNIGTGSDIVFQWDGTDLLVSQLTADSIVKWGVSGAGINHQFYGDTATYDMMWDQTNDQLLFNDNAKIAVGSGAGGVGDVAFSWDATRLNVTQLTTNSEIRWGVDGAGMDQRFYGDTASADLLWDQSLDALIFEGVASARGFRTSSLTAAAITGVTTLTLADSGGVFSVAQSSAYDVALPDPTTGPGCKYVFYLTAPGAFNVTISTTGASTFVGTIVNDVTSVIVATGSTLTFATGAAALGDTIECISISTSLYLVRAITSAAGGITVA